MAGYYREHLSGARLERVYALASPRIRQYLHAELGHVVEIVEGKRHVLELGCGYGRALREVAPHVGRAVGCDVALLSLRHAKSFLRGMKNCDLFRMNAARSGFRSNSFDGVVCIQNGISAFGVSPLALLAEAVRVSKEGGVILFSSYSPQIWDARLEWFREQAGAGLVGEIDEHETQPGTIVCKDGFRSSTVGGARFSSLFDQLGQHAVITEVDHSSVFAQVVKQT
jgi:2-polyprenyl-6-hydroxyphenyl methylase/3-demethylubiquinone-9 3-methyltransferase